MTHAHTFAKTQNLQWFTSPSDVRAMVWWLPQATLTTFLPDKFVVTRPGVNPGFELPLPSWQYPLWPQLYTSPAVGRTGQINFNIICKNMWIPTKLPMQKASGYNISSDYYYYSLFFLLLSSSSSLILFIFPCTSAFSFLLLLPPPSSFSFSFQIGWKKHGWTFIQRLSSDPPKSAQTVIRWMEARTMPFFF